MTRKQIRGAVKELRDTIHLQWGVDSALSRADQRHLNTLARLAYKYASHEAKMLAIDATLEAKDFAIRCLREEIRRIRPELKDCIAKGAGTSLPLGGGEDYTSDPKLIGGTD